MPQLDFGKYKGWHLEDVPHEYIMFLAGNVLVGTRAATLKCRASNWVGKFKSGVRAQARIFLNNKCWHCGSHLQPIGHMRSNGANHSDWETRRLHKKCWLELRKCE